MRARGPDKLREALAAGRIPLGLQCFSGSEPLVEIVGLSGFDFIMIDTEHACIDSAQVERLVRAADPTGLTTLVRVAENSPTLIRKALEAGAGGVIVPQVRTASEVEAAVAAARFPPAGRRGACPFVRGSAFSIEGWNEYLRWSNEELFVIPILEHPEAIAEAEQICNVPGVEIVLFGPGDLGLAMGYGIGGMSEPALQDMLTEVVDIGRRTDTLVMCVPFPDLSADACADLLRRGVRVLLHSIDELLFAQLCTRIVRDLSPLLTHVPTSAEAAP